MLYPALVTLAIATLARNPLMSTKEIWANPYLYGTIKFLMYLRLSSKRYLNYEFGTRCFIDVAIRVELQAV